MTDRTLVVETADGKRYVGDMRSFDIEVETTTEGVGNEVAGVVKDSEELTVRVGELFEVE